MLNTFFDNARQSTDFSFGVCRTDRTKHRLAEEGNPFVRKVLSPDEYTAYEMLRFQKRQVEWLSGRIAAKLAVAKQYYMLGRKFSWADISVHNDARHAPFVPAFPEWNLSISHSQEFAVAVLSRRPIGVDLEKIESRPRQLADYFCCGDEKNVLAELEQNEVLWNQRMTWFWTRKEAVAKFLKLGGAIGFHQINTIADRPTIGDAFVNPIQLLSEFCGDYAVTIALSSE
ncbi:MAG: 4'-phosphopantetheinyl transferase superfamily protein [Calditrichaeota bacterium]|nr:MAG: 4'-phosphopantetheinyl transferase superfamily protein [Calditrichota bacterium]